MYSFLGLYGDCVNRNFPNFYAIAKEGSKTNTRDFQAFLKAAKIPHSICEPSELINFGVSLSGLARAWKISEGVIDLALLKLLIYERLKNCNVEFISDSKVVSIAVSNLDYLIENINGDVYKGFNFIVIANYGASNIEVENSIVPTQEYEHQVTAIIEFSTTLPKFGLTIMDGDFLTFLPKGFTKDRFVAYGPTPSVLYASELNTDENFEKFYSSKRLASFESELEQRLKNYLPSIRELNESKIVLSNRSLPARVKATDMRVSSIQRVSKGVYAVSSGKIDHAADIADTICQKLKQQINN